MGHNPKKAVNAFSSANSVAETGFQIDNNSTFIFASAARGADMIAAKDDYTSALSPFDRSARMQVNRAVSDSEFLDFLKDNTLEWTAEEKEKIILTLKTLKQKTAPLSLRLPREIYLVKTTGKEEGEAAYTRSNAIFLPQDFLSMIVADESMRNWLICHESFHVLSRANPDLREKLYNVIGFEKCNEIAFPPSLKDRKISNPDAPKNDYFIRVRLDGTERLAVPVMYSSKKRYDCEKEPSLFKYVRSRLMLVEEDKQDKGHIKPFYNQNGRPVLVRMEDAEGFYEQIGRNTTYTVHPEEILAENFTYMVLEGEDWKPHTQSEEMDSPHILEAIRNVLKRPDATPKPAFTPR